MVDVIMDVIIDTVKMLPLVILTYILLDIYERNTNINNKINYLLSEKAGPIFGALIGCVPQCGFSFMAATLFNHQLCSVGTLVAVFIATSDEALPMLIANPQEYKMLIMLLVAKLLIAIVAGYLVDGIVKLCSKKSTTQEIEIDEDEEEQEIIIQDPTCTCGNSMIYNVTTRTAKVAIFVFIINLVLGMAIYFMGEESIVQLLASTKMFQPIVAALIGFIPNCAASIALTEFYLVGGLSFGALISGLCTGAGIGMLVLWKENKNKKQVLAIMSYLFLVSVSVGFVLQAIM